MHRRICNIIAGAGGAVRDEKKDRRQADRGHDRPDAAQGVGVSPVVDVSELALHAFAPAAAAGRSQGIGPRRGGKANSASP